MAYTPILAGAVLAAVVLLVCTSAAREAAVVNERRVDRLLLVVQELVVLALDAARWRAVLHGRRHELHQRATALLLHLLLQQKWIRAFKT